MNSNNNLQTPKLVGAIVITAVLLIGVYVLILNNKTNSGATTAITPIGSAAPTTSSTTPTPSPVTSTTNTSTTTTTSIYKDGTYAATANYRVPGDSNSIKVTVTVKNGAITSVNTQHSYGDRESVRYINSFVSAVTGAVVGKQLDAAQLSRLNGASDTTVGFDEALTTIISQAKA